MPTLWEWPCIKPDLLDRWAVYNSLSRLLDVDHRAPHKPWSWTLVDLGDRGCSLRVGLLDPTLVARLDRAHPEDIQGTKIIGPLDQVAALDWSALREGHQARKWLVEFVSPVTFRSGNQFLPWPAPGSVLGSLRATWHRFGAREAGPLELDLHLDPVRVLAFSGASSTERVDLDPPHRRNMPGSHGRVTVGGFLGSLTYGLLGEADPTAIGALIRLAPFSGVGAYSLRGFGGVARPPTCR
jgi:CRISPR-associated endoribonuclease Cas6